VHAPAALAGRVVGRPQLHLHLQVPLPMNTAAVICAPEGSPSEIATEEVERLRTAGATP